MGENTEESTGGILGALIECFVKAAERRYYFPKPGHVRIDAQVMRSSMKRADLGTCDCYTDSPLCGECTTARTPIDERPKCKQGHPCEMMPSHRWVCGECYEYAEEPQCG